MIPLDPPPIPYDLPMNTSLIELLRILVSQETVHGKTQEISRLFAYIDAFFGMNQLRVHRQSVKGVQTVLYLPKGVKRPRILFCGHLDIVPCDVSQLTLGQKGDKLFGRGVYDMKGPIVAMLFAMKELLEKDPRAAIGLLLSSDEEVGGAYGVGSWIERSAHLLPDVVFLPDGGSPFTLVTEEKGVLQLEVTLAGKTGHASRAWEGTNAISLAAEGLKRVEKLYPPLKRIEDWRTSVVPTKIEAGTAINQIPGEVKLSFDIRHVPRDRPERILAQIRRCFPNANVQVLATGQPFFLPPKKKEVELFKRVFQTQFKKPLPQMHFSSACDARFFAAKGIPVLLLRSAGGDAHGPKEWVSLKGLEEYRKLLCAYAERHLEF